MKVEVISIGDELLIGQTINTNASWIGQHLLNIGIHLSWVTTVGDDADLLELAIKTAESRAEVLLITGGLGPTHDDITKKVVSDYFNSELILNEDILEQVKERFRKRGIPMVKINEEQALVPERAEIIYNTKGTAPGMIFTENGATTYIMPGVPREMKAMMTHTVLPKLKEQLGDKIILSKTLCTTGIPESTLFEKLGDIAEIEKYASIAFLPSLQGVKIRLMVSGNDPKIAKDAIQKAEEKIRGQANSYIYAEEQMPLEEAIAKMLTKKNETIAVAESCTGGLLANKLTNISGSSNFFERGVISYSNKSKMDLLAVPEEMLVEFGAVSGPVAKAMASGIRKKAQTTYGLSTTGIAGPTGGTEKKPVGTVYIGYSDKHKTIAKKFNFSNDRLGNKERSVTAALNLLRENVLKIEY
jgi:nicotinamide-nucleotide amidase